MHCRPVSVTIGQVEQVTELASFSEILWPDERTGPWGIRGNWVMLNGRPECVGLQIWRGAAQGIQEPFSYRPIPGVGLERITASAVAALPIGTIIARLRANARRHEDAYNEAVKGLDAPELLTNFFTEEREGRVGAPRRYRLDHFIEVAEVYLAAWQSGDKPTQAVADHFGVTRTAAAKWVARCRDVQLLSSAEHGRGGADPGPRLVELRSRRKTAARRRR